MKALIAASCLAFIIAVANAKEYPDCDPEAFKDIHKENTSDTATLSVLSLVNESNFKSFKDSFGSKITIPIEGVPVNFGGDWTSFNAARNELMRRYSTFSNSTASREYISYIFSDNGSENYSRCITAKIAETQGLHVLVEKPTERSFTAAIFWNFPARENEKFTNTTLTVTQDSDPPKIVQEKFRMLPGGKVSFPFTRDANVSTRLVVNNGTDSDTTTLAATPSIPEPALATKWSVTDNANHIYSFSFDGGACENKAYVTISQECGGLYDSRNYGVVVSLEYRSAEVKNKNPSTGAPICSPFPEGTITLVKNANWQSAFLRFDGQIDRAVTDTGRMGLKPTEVHAYVARLPAAMSQTCNRR